MHKPAAFDPSNYPAIQPVQGFSYKYSPPGKVRVRGNVEGDTFILDTSMDCWEIWYGGSLFTIDWMHADLEGMDSSLKDLWRHHLTEVVQQRSPSTVVQKFNCARYISNLLNPDLSLTSLLAVFARLYVENKSCEFDYLRVFYAWGLRQGFGLFDRNVQTIIADLRSPQRDAYASVFLHQNYVTPDQETRILRYIDKILSRVESEEVTSFNVDKYCLLRDASIMLLVFEVAPRAMQIFMSERGHLNSLNAGGENYYSMKFRRNKNRHHGVQFTSQRAISARLGRALKKVGQLNQLLFGQVCDDQAPIFLDANGKRLSATAIGLVVGNALKEVFDSDPLDVAGSTTVFRHHLGQSLADQGAPPAVISDRLGHSTEFAARAYIAATPNIAKIKTRALGNNETYKYLIAALMTGSIMRREDVDDTAAMVTAQ